MQTTARIKLPDKLVQVFSGDADIRGAHGGRGSGKTRSFATMTAVRGYAYGMSGISGLLLCTRQYMNSLGDSSFEEIKRSISDHQFLAEYYEIGEKYIKSRDGRISYVFAGLDRNIGSVKSKGRILLNWTDEAEPVTENALNTLIPTMREEGAEWNAECWFTWNPARKYAAVERFRKSKDPRIKIAEINWQDNPWFPRVLDRARLRDLEERPDEYGHVWGGEYGTVDGSILGKWMGRVRSSGRVCDVNYDPDGAPVHISSDIGFHDTAAWWYWQPTLGGYRLLAYDGDSGMDAMEWVDRVKSKLSMMGINNLGKVWLPHDAKARTFQSNHTSMERFVAGFGADKVGIVPMTKKSDQINAAREVIPKCEFDLEMCSEGIDGLEGWRFEWNKDTLTFSKHPLHDGCSHPADAFAYGCQVMQMQKPSPVQVKAKTVHDATLNDLWATSRQGSQRI